MRKHMRLIRQKWRYVPMMTLSTTMTNINMLNYGNAFRLPAVRSKLKV